MPATIVQETQEDLHKAWRLLRRPCWPDTYEATMQDPLRAQLVQMYAHHLALTAALPACGVAVCVTRKTPERRSQPAMPALFRPHPTVVDRKRAASGERDDD